MSRTLLASALFLVACGSSTPAATEPSPAANQGTSISSPTPVEPATAEAEPVQAPESAPEATPTTGCGSATGCDACLAMPGCNWTADRCRGYCMMDTWCMGPGNPASPVCNTPPVMTGGPGEG